MKSIDLFSGIGGLTLALSPVCKPVLYCDKHPGAKAVLASAMDKGYIPRAEIFHDVRELSRHVAVAEKRNEALFSGVEVVLAGFPCQDVSVMNIGGKGVHGDRSGLVFEVMRVAEATRASVVVLENSPNLSNRGIELVLTSLKKAGYAYIAWGVFSASDVGAPHRRKRLYLVAVKSGPRAHRVCHELARGLKVYDDLPGWGKEPVARVVRKSKRIQSELQSRGVLLGNAVVPMCARKACQSLATSVIDQKKTRSKAASSFVHVVRRTGHEGDDDDERTRSDRHTLKLTIPTHKIMVGTGFERRHAKNMWATPLSGNWWVSRVGSSRAVQHLPNQIMYENRTLARIRSLGHPNVDDWVVNPCFVEWLMGYPIDYTLPS